MPRTYQLIRQQWVPQSIEAAFAFFSRPENLQAITPPWLDFRIASVEPELRAGSLIRYRLRWHGVPMRWTTRIDAWDPPRGFVDTQISGPYALWRHQHTLTAQDGGTLIGDQVTYALPFGLLGGLAHRIMVRRDVEAIFNFRQRRMCEILGG